MTITPVGDASAAEPALELCDVRKEHPGGVLAVRDVTVSLRRGEHVGVIGRSGSGKSTMLNLMGTLERPTSGRVRLAGEDTAELDDAALSALRATRVGFVFQHSHLVDGLDAARNVELGLLYAGIRRDRRRARAEEALERVGLAHRRSHRPAALSGGERQRVAIARAIVGEPAIVLADEPTGALDTATGERILDLLLALHGDGSTLVVVTHDPAVAARMGRRITVHDGAIAADETTDAS